MGERFHKKDSWKDKIDPAFDKIIKFYIQFVEVVGLPSNKGWIGLEDEALNLWEKKGMQGWIKSYEKNMTNEKNTIIKWKIPKNVTEEQRNKARWDFEKQLIEEIKILPEDSQNYYKRIFAPFYSENISEDYFRGMTVEKLKGLYTDFITDRFLLSLHIAFVEMESECKTTTKEALEKKYIRQTIIFGILFSTYNSVSLLVFEKSLTDLIKEARNGNEESFFNLLQIDRTVVECDWAQKLIRKAQLTGDEDFFRRMAKAITKTPLDNAKQFTTARMVILLFWDLGLRKLKYYEIRKLLKSCGIVVQDTDAFRRFVQRLEDATRKKDIITFHKDTPSS
jgi:hypothetical protein